MLSKIQAELQQQIYGETNNADAASSLGISIYRNNLRTGLLQLLQDIFPVCKRVIGNQCFAKLVEMYISIHPSNQVDLHLYGGYFSEFIQPYAAKWQMDYLVDLCKLEWALHITEFAENNFSSNKLSSDTKVCLANNLQLLQSNYPIDQIWHENQAAEPMVVDLTQGASYLAILRLKLVVKMHSITLGEYMILEAMQNLILPVNELCEYLLTKDQNMPIIESLPNLFSKGIITGYEDV